MSKSQARKKRPYPYPLQKVMCPSEADCKQLDGWEVLKFFRVEALLRSETVQQMYLRDGGSEESAVRLFIKYGITWEVLKGEHHRHLCQKKRGRKYYAPIVPPIDSRAAELAGQAGILDMNELSRLFPAGAEHWKEYLLRDEPRFLHLQIDTSFKPGTIIEALRPILTERHKKAVTSGRGSAWLTTVIGGRHYRSEFRVPYHTSEQSPAIRDVKNWLDYLACYDLLLCEGLTYGEIAKSVYGTGGKQKQNRDKANKTAAQVRQLNRDIAEKAVERVDQLIEQAENNKWPPRIR